MPVLATKLHVPEPRSDLVSRPRLAQQLAAAEAGSARLVLISAPAGFGKTTVLTQWLKAGSGAARAVAWVSLDAGDNDVRRFLATVMAALQRTNPEVGCDAQALLDTADEESVDAVLISLVNDLDTLVEATVLVFDDYDEITAPAIHEVLGFLLDHLPAHVCVALTTRLHGLLTKVRDLGIALMIPPEKS